MATPYILNPSVTSPIVSVVPAGMGQQVTISWPAQPGSGGYRVYAGFDPIHIRSLISGQSLLPLNQTSFLFIPPATPPGQVVYFWVSSSVGGIDVFLDQIGSYLIKTAQLGQFSPSPFDSLVSSEYIADDQQYFFEEIRRRSMAISEDSSELVDVYIKQWTGLPDPTAQEALGEDTDYQSMTRDDRTYGTGFFPGFFPPVQIRMRFGALPDSLLDFQVPGLRPLLTNEAWTQWEPLLHENDLIVRKSTGQRYVISHVAPSNYRGVPITQRISLDIVNPTSPLQKVTEADVTAKWGLVNAADYMRAGFGIAANGSGGPYFLIF